MNLLQNRYRLLKLIGAGGFCQTYLAVDEGEFPPVPCVVQKLWHHNQTPDIFEQKAQWLEKLGKHPQIPCLLAHFQQDEQFYIVQEFITGTNLAQVVEEEGAFNETQIWQLLESLLPTLKFVHDRNIIHCDLKPQNIIRRSPGEFILVDFGVAQFVTKLDQLISTNIIGCPEYAAPEQTKGNAVFASDLYSLGVTCIYLLTQIAPFDLFDIANDSWVWQQYITTRVSDRLTKILNKLLQNSVNQRFQSVDEVIKALGIASQISTFKSPMTNSPWKCVHTFAGNSTGSSCVNALDISPDGDIFASGGDDKIIKLWDLNHKKILSKLPGHSQGVTSIAFSPNGGILATASDDKTIKLWHLHPSREIYTLCGHLQAVKSVAFSPDGQILASGGWDKRVKLWDVNTGAEICTFTGHQLQVSAVAFSPQGQILASASFDRTIRLWQVIADSQEKLLNRPYNTLLDTLSGHTRAVLTVAFSPDGNTLATGGDDNTIKLWDIDTGELISTLLGHSWSVVALTFTTDGETLISASWDKTVKLWRVSTAEEITTLSGHVDSVSAVAVSQVAQLIVSGSRDKTIKLWQLVQQQGS